MELIRKELLILRPQSRGYIYVQWSEGTIGTKMIGKSKEIRVIIQINQHEYDN